MPSSELLIRVLLLGKSLTQAGSGISNSADNRVLLLLLVMMAGYQLLHTHIVLQAGEGVLLRLRLETVFLAPLY